MTLTVSSTTQRSSAVTLVLVVSYAVSAASHFTAASQLGVRLTSMAHRKALRGRPRPQVRLQKVRTLRLKCTRPLLARVCLRILTIQK